MDVIINKIHQLTPSIRAFELVSENGADLPEFDAGAHIDVHLKNGLIRQYSLANCSSERHRYVIGVLHDEASRGGSSCMHSDYVAGDVLTIGAPRNLFAVHAGTKRAVLFAGGIGITPIISMAYRLQRQGVDFELHYFVRSHEMIAFYGNLTEHFAGRVHFHIQDQPDSACDMAGALCEPSSDKHLYVCGPNGFMDFVTDSARNASWNEENLHQEHFVAQVVSADNNTVFDIEIAGTGQTITVAPQQSALDALLEHGFDIPVSCEQGVCGTCLTRVLAGEPEHRDVFMTDAERALNNQFTPCCSRAKSGKLVIELA